MSDNTEALRLADVLDARVVPRWVHATGQTPQQKGHTPDAECVAAAAELRRLHAENEALRVARAECPHGSDAACKECYAEPEQEPVAIVGGQRKGWFYLEGRPNVLIGDKLYTAPPQRRPLTDAQHDALMKCKSTLDYGRAVEAAHGITNQETN